MTNGFDDADGFMIVHHRAVGPSCYFGPFETVEEAQDFVRDNPQVSGLIIPMYLSVDWNR